MTRATATALAGWRAVQRFELGSTGPGQIKAKGEAVYVALVEALAERDRLRDALVGLVGTGTREELVLMATTLPLLPAEPEDTAASLAAVQTLLAVEG